MEDGQDRVASVSRATGAAEERMLGMDLVREMVARKERGEGLKRIARELGVDRKTVKRWLRLGSWQPRNRAVCPSRSSGSPSSSRAERRRLALTRWCCSARIRASASPGAISRCGAFYARTGLSVSGRSWRRCGSRAHPASRRRLITANSGSGTARSWRRSICSCLRWDFRADRKRQEFRV